MKITPQYRQAEIENVNAESGTFDVVWTTGARVERQPWFDESYYEELEVSRSAVDLSRLNSGAPFLNSHNAYNLGSVIGVVERAWIDGDKGMATIRLSNRPDIEPIRQDIKDKILRNISVGYSVQKYKALDERVNDKKVYRAIRWTPMEISAVAIPADAGAQFRANESQLYEVEVIRMINENNNPAGTETSAGAERPEKRQQDPTPTPANTDPEAIARAAKLAADAAVAAERQRSADIRGLVARSNLPATLADELVNSGADIEAARSKVLDAMIERSSGEIGRDSASGNIHIRITTDMRENFRAGVKSSLLSRAGLKKDETTNAYRGHTLLMLAAESLRMHGADVPRMAKLELAGRAFTHTSSDFTNVLADIANKAMMMGWEEQEETYPLWTRPGNLPDFKTAKRVDLNLFPALAKIEDGAEYTYATIGDRGESIQLATYGKAFSVTRQTIINDDLDSMTRIPQRMGRAARRTVGNLVYAVLTGNPAMSDSVALFHSSHSNLLTGSAINTGSVDAMRVAMATQKDPASNPAGGLNIRLAYLIVPVALEGTANVVRESEYEVGATTRNNTVPNSVRNTFTVISDARLDASSAAAWYGAASAAMHDTIEVAYLDGNDQPFLDQQDGWKIDGTEFKVRIDAGVKALDFRGLAKNPGP